MAIKSGVVSLDQEVVFISDKGVMLLTGSTVQCISEKMNGKHYQIESSVATALSGSDWSSYVTAASDSDTFMKFVKESDIVYDYAGTRLLFFNPSKAYGYVYHFATTSWHKFTLPSGMAYTNPVNTYPEATASMTDGKQYLYLVCSEEALLDDAASLIHDLVPSLISTEEVRKLIGGGYGFDITNVSSSNVESIETAISGKSSATVTYTTKSLMSIYYGGTSKTAFISAIRTATSLSLKDIKAAVEGVSPLDISSLTATQLTNLSSALTSYSATSVTTTHLYASGFVPSARATAKTALTTAGFTSAQAESALLGENGLDLTGLTAEAVTSLRSTLTGLGISSQVTTAYRLFNYSTVIDVLSTTDNYGIIATRPVDLGEPDVRKAIKSIRVRGAFNHNDVRYILLGSYDGQSWSILNSLRTGSYKLFRIILLTKLTPVERISWIDVDYESRYATKLR